ncbi:hypothetical protein QLQ12_40030 [Actinoplanes sp. NEAU-A12]|uniref:Uncharacterized protein n=1 Tax=Actinoplanes sandaracinus TaxID=3045177 RepID=A0ABT6WYI9_9ACTN|nr:hypothetical protein [Actinoplanes sandaracinus]MDI6104797.1 hypothetical protein [Actinoplanes sandaracinus]
MAEMEAIEDDVRFAWAAAERLAAEFQATAAILEGQVSQRNTIAGEAKREWRGVYAEQFTRRLRTCTSDTQRLAEAMRAAANQVDELAGLAREEQNNRKRAREWAAREKNEGFLEKVEELFTGEGDKPPAPPPGKQPHFTAPAPVAGGRE